MCDRAVRRVFSEDYKVKISLNSPHIGARPGFENVVRVELDNTSIQSSFQPISPGLWSEKTK